MRRRVRVTLVLELREDVRHDVEPQGMLQDIADAVRSWGGQRCPADPLFYPFRMVRAELKQNGAYYQASRYYTDDV